MIYFHRCLILHWIAVGAAGTTQKPPVVFKTRVEAMLTELVHDARAWWPEGYGDLVMQIGWKSASEDFAVAAGTLQNSDKSSRVATAEDTFLFGSGTKSVVAAAVMRLIDAGRLNGSDSAAAHIDPYLMRTNGTTMSALFNTTALNKATVLDLLHMSAGIPDFEASGDTYDETAIENPNQLWSPYDAIHFTASKSPGKFGHLECMPGKCVEYSSTNYEFAGLLLMAVLHPGGLWYDLDLAAAAFPDASRYPSLRFPPVADELHSRLSDHLTVPGMSIYSGKGGHSRIYDQNPSVNGWTCGSMVGKARDVAAFFYDLLGSGDSAPGAMPIVSDASRKEMRNFRPVTLGWGAEWWLYYGAGLMPGYISMNKTNRGTDDDWSYQEGHGGSTYGFTSLQSYVPKLKAAMSVVSSIDDTTFNTVAMCRTLAIAVEVLVGQPGYLNCTTDEEYLKQAYQRGTRRQQKKDHTALQDVAMIHV
mmetsp:Transcript_34079/g.98057  ORF Transcript_34079/g.98057 Transcript_34079/m.98057 type:complete len:475 (+) Transcript_34079:115-1539(+)